MNFGFVFALISSFYLNNDPFTSNFDACKLCIQFWMLGFVASVIEGNVLAICDCSLFKIVSYINLFAWLGFSLTHLYNISKSLCLQFLILRQCTTVFYIYFLTPERSFSGKQVGPRHTSCPSSTLHSGDNMTVCEADPGRWIPPSDYLML